MLSAHAWIVLVLAVLAGAARGNELPRWELGAGVAAAYLPDYRGADESRAYALPVPYFVYRGERLRADRDGLRGELFESDRVELNVSVGIGIPVRSNRNEARRGMTSLDPVLEAGPSLNILLAEEPARRSDWRLLLPLRAAVAIDDTNTRSAGAVFSPRLRYTLRAAPWAAGATVRLAGGPNFATRDYHGYTYDVPAVAATAARPQYRARGGYSGLSLSLTADRSLGPHRFFVYAVADSIHGAAFESSPLVRRSTGFGAGFAYFYVFAAGGAGRAER